MTADKALYVIVFAACRRLNGRMHKIFKAVIALAIPFAAGAIGNLATSSAISGWYTMLDKPPLLPPNYVFGPVWMLLYVTIGVALYLVWVAKTKRSKYRAYSAFTTQMILNTLWSLVFFGLQMPWAGVVVIVLLIGAIAWAIYEFWYHTRLASYLLVPYILWVCFATYLTIGVAVLN